MKNKVELILTSGDGGAGCVSFRKEKFVSRGGPDGGDGGDGGDVVLIPDKNMYDLDCFYDLQKFKASSGEPGGKKNKNGRRGKDLEITLESLKYSKREIKNIYPILVKEIKRSITTEEEAKKITFEYLLKQAMGYLDKKNSNKGQ